MKIITYDVEGIESNSEVREKIEEIAYITKEKEINNFLGVKIRSFNAIFCPIILKEKRDIEITLLRTSKKVDYFVTNWDKNNHVWSNLCFVIQTNSEDNLHFIYEDIIEEICFYPEKYNC